MGQVQLNGWKLWHCSRVPPLPAFTLTMECKNYCLLTWNINGLQARLTDLHSYVITKRPGIIALQEVGPHVPALRGYETYILGCDNGSSRGLVMYVKSGLPVTFREKGSHHGVEFIIVTPHTPNESNFLC